LDVDLKIYKKICMLGDPAVGKTSLVRRLVTNLFDDKYQVTLGTKLMKKEMWLDHPTSGEAVHLVLIIHDIFGQKGFEAVHRRYIAGSEGALIVCDMTRKETLASASGWVDLLTSVTGEVPLFLLANKNDLEGSLAMSPEEVENSASQLQTTHFMTSAKTGENVEKAFDSLARRLLS